MNTITTILVDSQILIYIDVAMLTLLSYDYFLSLAQEITYVWPSNWGFVKVLYLISRYSPFIDTILAVAERLNPDIDIGACNSIMTFNTIFAGLGIGISDLVLIIRTYTVYQRSRKVLVVLIVTWISVAVEPSIAGIPSCFLAGESKTGLINFISLLAGETVVVALTLWQALRQQYFKFGFAWSSDATQNLIVTFYRDGVLFYMCILPITLANALLLAFASPELQVLQTPLRVMHSILCCRLVIHIREVADIDQKNEVEELPELVFRNGQSGSEEDIEGINLGSNSSEV
ncbi:hypothetical protein BT96DRAFT_419698 [Gymnopus androsaceus JB14]|uniref:DUF6533 domain-containing protein n=1 Tax=Gymnopus androsaceus JB14 TaxID=1447944 RepID=A0A6A4I186_9AGAR|nr:hypothetical protein BT96DRAFT_419698 [Gymnopus androsaceus JB14]